MGKGGIGGSVEEMGTLRDETFFGKEPDLPGRSLNLGATFAAKCPCRRHPSQVRPSSCFPSSTSFFGFETRS